MTYRPTFVFGTEIDEATAQWFEEQQGDEMSLEDIVDVCATLNVKAKLRNEQGSHVGDVDSSGDFNLNPRP
jgi:hypothetical protein